MACAARKGFQESTGEIRGGLWCPCGWIMDMASAVYGGIVELKEVRKLRQTRASDYIPYISG